MIVDLLSGWIVVEPGVPVVWGVWVIIGVGPLGLPAREVAPMRRHPLALGSPEIGVGSRHAPLELLHLGAAKFVLGVLTVVAGIVAVRIRVGARRGLENLVQQVVRELRLLPHPLVVPVHPGGGMPALPRPVPRSAFLVELVRTLHRPGAPLASSPFLALAPLPFGHFVLL